jgi:hypothetical protein
MDSVKGEDYFYKSMKIDFYGCVDEELIVAMEKVGIKEIERCESVVYFIDTKKPEGDREYKDEINRKTKRNRELLGR